MEAPAPDWSTDKILKDSFDYCDYEKPPTMEDRASLTSNTIWISWESLREPALGREVLAHEMGHWLSGLMQFKKPSAESFATYQAIRNCLEKKHPEFQDETLFPEARKQQGQPYIEEDWGDLVSSVAAPEANLGCSLSHFTENKPSLVNWRPLGQHKTNL